MPTIPEEVLEMIRRDRAAWAAFAEKFIIEHRIESVIQDERVWIESAIRMPEFSNDEKIMLRACLKQVKHELRQARRRLQEPTAVQLERKRSLARIVHSCK